MQIKNKYSFLYKLKLLWWLLRTKCIAPKARLIRFPFDVRGRKYIDFGNRFTTGRGCRIEAFSQTGDVVLKLGENIQINDYVHISAAESIIIGNGVLMASHIYISDNSHGSYKGDMNDSCPDIPPCQRNYVTAPVIIGDNVWLAEHVIVMPGVVIGKGSIIGSNSVVTKSIPPYTIAVGQPAKPIKIFDFNILRWSKI